MSSIIQIKSKDSFNKLSVNPDIWLPGDDSIGRGELLRYMVGGRGDGTEPEEDKNEGTK
jgi:hypothetical protein